MYDIQNCADLRADFYLNMFNAFHGRMFSDSPSFANNTAKAIKTKVLRMFEIRVRLGNPSWRL